MANDGGYQMKIAIVYDSSTGTTAKAAEAMGKTLQEQGHECQVQSVMQADPAAVSEADLICVGSWVHGLFIRGDDGPFAVHQCV